MKFPRRFFLCALIVLFLAKLVLAEEPITQPPEPASSFTDKISLDLKGVDINELFKVLSAKTGITIIPTPEVKGRVTVFMDNLNISEALNVIVTMQDLAYERMANNVIKVMTTAEYEKAYGKKFGEHKATRTIKLTYAKPANVLNVINALKSDLGKIISDDATGTIILMDTPQSMDVMADTIKELDQPLESVVFNVNYARFADLKNYLNEMITPGVGQIFLDERSSKVVVYDLPQRLARIRKMMQEFDEQSRQVLISGEIVEVNVNDKFQSGIEWDKILRAVHLGNPELTAKFPVTPALPSFGKISVGTLAQDDYNVVINMLNEYGSTEILNRPRIVVVNKEEAKILVGTREAYITGTQSQATSTTITSENAQFIDVGVKLIVVPTIGSDGFITMKLKPEVSSVQRTLTSALGAKIPIVQTSQSETVVKVKDGRMLIIAGLLQEEDINDGQGLPVLSRVPILGHLFSAKTNEKKKSELVIFITPTIITGTNNVGYGQK